MAGPQTIMDGDLGTGWIADPADRTPTITVTLPRPTSVSSMTLIVDPYLAATAPDSVVVTARQGARAAKIGPNGAITFAPLVTDQLTIRLIGSYGLRSTYDPVEHSFSKLGLGVSELSIGQLKPPRSRADTDPTPVQLPCGSTPDLVLDGNGVAYPGQHQCPGAARTGAGAAASCAGPATRCRWPPARTGYGRPRPRPGR